MIKVVEVAKVMRVVVVVLAEVVSLIALSQKNCWTYRHGTYGYQVVIYPDLGHCREETHNDRMGGSVSNQHLREGNF